jgi:Ser/Thr protein kinase RdoA (MazF antagonist)
VTRQPAQPDGTEQPLTGGNVSAGIVRVGDTVRRPAGFWSRSVDAFLRHLEDVGFDGAPRSLGFDGSGRHVLSYVPGELPFPFRPADPVAACRRVGALIRDFHDAAASFVAPADARWNVVITPDTQDLIVHHDLAPWNLVCGATRWVFIDWDAAGPGSRLWDLAYAAHGFLPLDPRTAADDAGRRLAALADGYRLDDQGRHELGCLLVRRIRSMVDLLRNGHRSGNQPWARLWDEGHGASWSADADYTRRHLDVLSRALQRPG